MSDVGEALRRQFADDPWMQSLGVQLLEVREGYCRASLTVAPHMRNFQGNPHGGVVFSLADVAFGVACNSYGIPAVALSMTVSYLGTVAPGARLVAEATVRKQGRRAGFYEVSVTTDDGVPVAAVHCVSHRVGGG